MPAALSASHASSRVRCRRPSASTAGRIVGLEVSACQPWPLGEAVVGRATPGCPTSSASALELVLAHDLHDEPAVGGPEALHDHRPCGARRGARPSDQKFVTMSVIDDHGVEHGDVDVLALAGGSRWRSAASTPMVANSAVADVAERAHRDGDRRRRRRRLCSRRCPTWPRRSRRTPASACTASGECCRSRRSTGRSTPGCTAATSS